MGLRNGVRFRYAPKRPEFNGNAALVNMNAREKINHCLNTMQRWWWPAACLLCGQAAAGRDFCTECERSLPYLGPACPRCALPLPVTQWCGACQQQPPRFARTTALFRYAPPVDRFIHALKYQGALHYARVLGQLLAPRLWRLNSLPDLIIPVPLHGSRLRERGYNQALELARPLAKALNLPLDYRCLRRTRATAPQIALPPEQRRRNVHGAFWVDGSVKGRRVALVDDVMTTGHTVNAAAACLRQAKAKSVEVWVVARA